MNNVLLIFIFCLAEGYLNNGIVSISITRHHNGDIFIAQGNHSDLSVLKIHFQSSHNLAEEEKCYKDFCASLSEGTALPTGNRECECKCTPSHPVFRDDLNICVDDIHECNVVPFASNSVSKKIPYVFLPLKGQIVYPSADIIVSDVGNPVCVVSGGQFLGLSGWSNLRNNSGMETPFRLFRDEGRTYLQWAGESSLRAAMEGRIILVHLMCKDASVTAEPKAFTPCIAFRVAGNPSVKEIMFITDVHLKEEYGGGLSMREYIAIGICSLLLAIIYIAAVFLYLHVRRKRHKGSKKVDEDVQLTLGEEGVIKNNPLLQATRHLSAGGQDNEGYISESISCSDADQTSDLLCLEDQDLMGSQNMQTSAIIHPCDFDYAENAINQDSNNIEKLPEENVSIVETLEVRDDHSETIKAMTCASGRRKLYFNPSYFEPDLLKAPPPAAMEFLVKIREIIAIAKHKMSAKKFSPSLLEIPEEDGSSKADGNSVLSARKNPTVVEKCETRKSPMEKSLRDNFHLLPSELCWPSDTKQKIIRKWLEDVPVMIMKNEEQKSQKINPQEKILSKSLLWQTNKENVVNENTEVPTPPVRLERRKTKAKAPPIPPLKTEKIQESKIEKIDSFKDAALGNTKLSAVPLRPSPMPSFIITTDEIPRVQGKDCVPPAIAKNLMDAVIQELASYKENDTNSKLKELPERINDTLNDYNDNLMQNCLENGSETAKPSQENAIRPGINETKISKSAEEILQDDHEYEIILLNGDLPSSDGKELKIYNLPEILSKNDRSEGYSLVSEVYVNDSYGCYSGESPPSSCSDVSIESDKVHYDTPNEKPGRLTIHVNDSPERYKTSPSESDNFEPDTLDRKPRRTKPVKINDENERYSNQKFQDMECYIDSNKSENFMDSLERPSILLKTNGTFKSNDLEKDIGNFFKNISWSKVENVGSLREIYEAKISNYKKKMETTSLIARDTIRRDHDRFSTLSWSEERKNKLLHRGIILHINEGEGPKHKRSARCKQDFINSPKVLSRPQKPCPSSRSGSMSPIVKSGCNSPSSFLQTPSRSMSPPVPPPRSAPVSPLPRSVTVTPPPGSPCLSLPHSQPRSTNNSPVLTDRQKNYTSNNNATQTPSCSSPILPQFTSLLPPSSTSPPPRPPKTIGNSPLLPPRSTKPPLPPKNSKRNPKPGKFSGRPLPPLPRSTKDYTSPTFVPCRDPETLSTLSGASMDSLNSSEYEEFYTLPYEEEEEEGSSSKEDFKKSKHAISNAITIVRSSASVKFNSSKRIGNYRSRHAEKSCRSANETMPFRPEDSGYLSTDSDSICPQLMIPLHFSKIAESGSQNSETEESLCDGASESGGESTATDSFFYGNFKKKSGKISESGGRPEIYPYSLRLSDVEVNSDTERHCVPIMVKP